MAWPVAHRQAFCDAFELFRSVFADFLPRNFRLAFGRPKPSAADQPAKVGVAAAVGGEQDDRGFIVDGNLRTDDQMHAEFDRFLVRVNDSVNAVAIF